MEFKYRAGEDRPSSHLTPSTIDGYFTTQALRAGYVRGNFQGADPSQNPIIPARDALRRELEKERIREEIIAREILHKRELEEEVRRELAYEREIALRRQADRFSLAGPTVSALQSEQQRLLLPPPTHGVRFVERFPISGPHDVGVVDRLPISGRHDFGIVERFPLKRLLEARESEIRRIPEVGRSQVVFLGNSTSSPNLAGTKRKAAVEITQLASPKKVQQEWSCAVCQVRTTGERGLNEHFKGKKHKAKEEELRASKPGSKNKGAFTLLKKADKLKPLKKGATTNDQQKPLVSQSGEQQVQKNHNQNGVVRKLKGHMLRCEHCEVKCNSESMLASHLGGKKHLARMQELGLGTEGNVDSELKQRKKEVAASETMEGVSTDGMPETTDAPTDEMTQIPTVDDISCKMEFKEEKD